MSEWTKGPWRIKTGPNNQPDECDLTIAGDIFLLADIKGPNYAHCEANANLIAAAPDLYEALEIMFEATTAHSPYFENVSRQARSALAKARGEKA